MGVSTKFLRESYVTLNIRYIDNENPFIKRELLYKQFYYNINVANNKITCSDPAGSY